LIFLNNINGFKIFDKREALKALVKARLKSGQSADLKE